jgi:hypothetical protein
MSSKEMRDKIDLISAISDERMSHSRDGRPEAPTGLAWLGTALSTFSPAVAAAEGNKQAYAALAGHTLGDQYLNDLRAFDAKARGNVIHRCLLPPLF